MTTFLWVLLMLAVTGFLTYLGVMVLRQDQAMRREREDGDAKSATDTTDRPRARE